MDSKDEPGKKAMDFMELQGEGSAKIPTDVDGSQGNYTAGTGSGLIRDVKPSADIIEEVVAEATAGMKKLQGLFS